MATFDPATIRKAVEEFTPRRPQKFQDLLPAKDVIIELRQKRASYRSIADLLTQHCLPTSKTAVAAFCHQVLRETVRPRKRATRKRSPAIEPEVASDTPSAPAPAAKNGRATEPNGGASGDETAMTRSRGPRIAQVRMLKPEST